MGWGNTGRLDCETRKVHFETLNRPVKETDDVITCFRDGEVLSEPIGAPMDLRFL